MELKRLLTRAKVLLLQGSHEGTESFIEQAMAEAGKIKSELCELDTLRKRVTEMAAEVERLQSVIDEANAQGPVGYTGSGSIDAVKVGVEGHLFGSSAPSHPIALYARPIPAQQSPLEYSGGIPFVPWSKEKEFFESMQQSPAGAVPEGFALVPKKPNQAMLFAANGVRVKCGNDVDGDPIFTQLNTAEATEVFNAFLSSAPKSSPSPRITEQDAREIVMSAWRYWMNGYGRTIDTWSEEEWPNVFNKINGDQNGK